MTEYHGIADILPEFSGAFKEFQVQETICLPAQEPDINEILNVYVIINITGSTAVQIPKAISGEGQILAGKKLLIKGTIEQKIEYTTEDGAVYAPRFSIPFSSYIVLDEKCSSDYEVRGYVEDISVRRIDNRKIYFNMLILSHA